MRIRKVTEPFKHLSGQPIKLIDVSLHRAKRKAVTKDNVVQISDYRKGAVPSLG
ncbi:hypothetical protein [Aliiglaciecola sp. LCG003]|uniref:hypothetical protein n=1 Tax=Aliiglaciecola sp. LCG003 TaxID=3053655 RepID=UPI00257468C1|nr:hypothetical protein [Aliiglaciecola sp. LCG003]WJG08940.1 hypothetical protein QR722_16650 [Aliiglaciecola sp. LCG003]